MLGGIALGILSSFPTYTPELVDVEEDVIEYIPIITPIRFNTGSEESVWEQHRHLGCKAVKGRGLITDKEVWAFIEYFRVTKSSLILPDVYVTELGELKNSYVFGPWVRSFSSFISHVGLPNSGSKRLIRINPKMGYVPGNVMWATQKRARSESGIASKVVSSTKPPKKLTIKQKDSAGKGCKTVAEARKDKKLIARERLLSRLGVQEKEAERLGLTYSQWLTNGKPKITMELLSNIRAIRLARESHSQTTEEIKNDQAN